ACGAAGASLPVGSPSGFSPFTAIRANSKAPPPTVLDGRPVVALGSIDCHAVPIASFQKSGFDAYNWPSVTSMAKSPATTFSPLGSAFVTGLFPAYTYKLV